MRHPAIAPAFLLCYVGALLFAFVPVAFVPGKYYDEFTILSDGLRILNGEVMYRDFFEFVTPLSPVIAAATFAFTGPGVLAPRLVQAALLVVAGCLFYALARRFALPRPLAALPGLAFAFSCFERWPVYSHHWLAVPFLLAGVLAGVIGLDTGRRRWWALAGGAAGGGFLVLQSDGLVIGAVLVAALIASVLLGGTPWREAARMGAALAAGLAAPLAVTVLYLASQGALGAFWADAWVFPTTQYRMSGNTNNVMFGTDVARDLPGAISLRLWYQRAYHVLYGYLLITLMPLLALLWGLDAIARRLRTGVALAPADIRFGLLALATVASFAVLARGRADTTHVFIHLVFGLIFAAVLAWRWAARFPAERHVLLRWLPTATLVAFVAVGAFEQVKKVQHHWPEIRALRTPEQVLAQEPLLRWVMAHTAPGDRIAVYPWGGFYYLFGRPPATGYSLLYHPAMHYNTADQFAEATAQLAARRPRLVLITAAPGDAPGPDNPYSRALPPGYRLVHTQRSSLFIYPVYVYERVDG